ncbi:DUF1080 domain-containing protein [Verrucomicrobiales bacterium]|nr:DUF1080 domain-containing protein [Verrucomicrobiales bacterium]MDC0259007.1 DUF1080 domain-containing protein [Verrucomicrobiales bacterium]
MKIPIALTSLLLLSFLPFTNAQEEGFKPLFNGKNLEGWDGNPALWSIVDGVVTGKTKTPEDLKYNEFLIWRGGKVKNFELKAKIKIEGNNSGIQYRSKELPDVGKWVISGYQCDVHPTAENNAMMYHEKGRGIIAKNGQDVVVDPDATKWLVAERDPVAVDTAKWHEYTIIAKGNQLTHKIDGKLTAHIIDHDKAGRSMEGLLALQIHRGPAMTVQIKDLMLKVLPEGGGLSFEKTNIPNDAQVIEKPAAKGKRKGKGKAAPKAMPKGNGKASQAKAKAKAKAKPKKAQTVGPRVGQNIATPVDRIKALPGFEVELLYSVPGGEQGSWVALCSDPNGRIYASDQYGDLYSFDPPAAGKSLSASDVKKVPVNIRAINGMAFHEGAIWAGVNDYEKKIQSGLYKISDSDGNGELDKVEMLRAITSSGDHGVHAVVPIPEGGFYLITGNNADPTKSEDSSPVAAHWADDHLLERMPDGRGHNRSRLAPGGIIYKVSADGKKFERFASGFRNIYGGDLNRDGELFTYDADMEYDFNTPWYRPTRVNHVLSGGEYGWRNGAGKYPEFFPDTLPATLNIGPGSPTGTRFGYGAKFPTKYQDAFYVLDWSWGKLYAVHLKPDGASYMATKEDFITGAPLPITDLIIHPKDGGMYFAIGGRRVQSGLYRVTYTGDEDTTPAPSASSTPSKLVQLRRELESFHGKQSPAAVGKAWEYLDHKDRHISWAARIILEHQPVSEWAEKALRESAPEKQLPALMTLARVSESGPAHRANAGGKINAEMRNKIIEALLKIDYAKLSQQEKLVHLRTLQIVLHRAGDPAKDSIDALVALLDPALPADNFSENWLLLETLAHLQAPNTAKKGMALIAGAIGQEQQMQHARSLRFLKTGWTPKLREAQLNWFLRASNYKGGASFDKFIEFIRTDSLATFTDAEKKQHAELIAKKAEKKSAIENVGAIFAGRTPKMWTLDELSAASKKKGAMSGRDFVNGRKMFSAAACYACHRFENEGGMTGPDLTGSGGRYSPHDLLDQIINPSKEINEQFAPIVVTKNNGEVASGVVVNLNGDNVTLNTDVSNPNQRVNIDRKEVKSLEVSKVSPMPPMLLSMLTEDEVMDLVAFILSGGDKNNEMFKK